MKVRQTQLADIPAITVVLDETGLFPSELLPQMIDEFLTRPDAPDVWLTCELDKRVIGFCYAMPETLAEGAWNMLAIAVLPGVQGHGAGAALVAALEQTLRSKGQRIIIADTSGTEAFAKTRQFYLKADYVQEARIRDFWAEGDDKIVFWKSLKG